MTYVMNMKEALIMFVTTVIKCQFWYWLSWSHYNFLMTTSISTTVVEVKKNIHDTVIMALW